MKKQYSLGIDGLRTSLSPPPIDSSSSLTLSSSKSEHEDSIFRDYTLDLSFLSSDDSLSNLSRHVDTTKGNSKTPVLLLGSRLSNTFVCSFDRKTDCRGQDSP